MLPELVQAANAAWNMGEWDQMTEYVSRLDDGNDSKLHAVGNATTSGDGNNNGAFFRVLLLVRRQQVEKKSGSSPLSQYATELWLRSQQRNDSVVESRIPEMKVDEENRGDEEEVASVFSSSWLPVKKSKFKFHGFLKALG